MSRATLVGGLIGGLAIAAVLTGCVERSTTEADGTDSFVNPYEFVGEAHNAGLAYGIQQLAGRQKIGEADISAIVDQFLKERKGTYPSGSYLPLELNWADFISPPIRSRNHLTDVFTEHMEEEGVSARYRGLALQIFDLVWGEDIEGLKDLERRIFEMEMKESEYAGLLSGIAVARHSYQFWTTGTGGGAAKATDLLPIVSADVWGASVGAIGGAVVGGPAGSAAGAVGGGICASLGEYFLG